MILQKPKNITQGYGGNRNKLFYASAGHLGNDFVVGYGKPVLALAGGEVSRTLEVSDPRIGYQSVYIIVKDEEGKMYQVSYGHLSKILVKKGDYVQVGDVIGLEGNGGNVFSGGKVVTDEERLNGSTRGSHVHLAVKPLDENGNVPYSNDDTKGTVDPALFYPKESTYDLLLKAFGVFKTLKRGSKGEQVQQAQVFLNLHGAKLSTDGMFGIKTENAVKDFQEKNGLKPDAIIGKETWKKLLA
jgi:murein DD-endopeptidase MepM/ murein hydrolase activator NlpD